MTSTRLPGKVLEDLSGRPVLIQQLLRLRSCQKLDDIVVATTTNVSDLPICHIVLGEGIKVFRGDEHDVLSRYVGAAKEHSADVIVRLTADCPLIDPGVVDCVVEALLARLQSVDYTSNVITRTYPRGLDVEVFRADVLFQLDRLATLPEDREHVTSYLRKRTGSSFQLHSVIDEVDNSDLRWTIDTPSDLQLMRKLFQDLHLNTNVLGYRQIVEHVRRHPELAVINESSHTYDPVTQSTTVKISR